MANNSFFSLEEHDVYYFDGVHTMFHIQDWGHVPRDKEISLALLNRDNKVCLALRILDHNELATVIGKYIPSPNDGAAVIFQRQFYDTMAAKASQQTHIRGRS
ncbi:MAG TPA: hypothetical protein VJK03_05595 [Candidatus Nanoarchaeia archaeon]|nr:hypothetical protein [Candidatus Nanoarchaeia archaeon]